MDSLERVIIWTLTVAPILSDQTGSSYVSRADSTGCTLEYVSNVCC